MKDAEDRSTALHAHAICKRFGATQANDNVSLTLRYGCIHALLGENGAGKSTLLSILYGLYPPDSGSIEIDGRTAVMRHPADALRLGLGLVQQHFSLIPAFTVLENILLGEEGWLIDKHQAEKTILERLEPFGLNLPLHRRAGELPVGLQQQVEIAKVLFRRARIMLFDEPTAALVPREIDEFLETLQRLRGQGIAVALITHRLPEVMRVADDVTVLRKGRVVLQEKMADTSAECIAQAIVGESLSEEIYQKPEPGSPVLWIKNACFSCSSAPQTFEVCEREILGIAGVAGNGQEEMIDGLLGHSRIPADMMILDGEDIRSLSLAQRKSRGIAYIPQDRLGRALLPHQTLFENYCLNREALPGCRQFILPRHAIAERARACLEEYRIQAASLYSEARSLSGGHQQRLIISRELLSHPKLIVAHEPARGLDLRATRFVHEQLADQCRQGTGVILFSSEWTHLFLLCHRIAVLYRGALVEIREAEQWTLPELGRRMVGME